MRKLALRVCFFTLLVPASVGLASDGVLEINETCARDTGCFGGDTAGFPVTISRAGSYRLTGNLNVPDKDTDGIVVSASDVGIDLNNFAIIGPVTCSGVPLTCSSAAGSGSGIERTSASNLAISVKNGSITGMGRHGVDLGDQAEVMNLRVHWNRADGISAAAGSTILNNTVYQNGGRGIYALAGSTISGNTAYRNGTTFNGLPLYTAILVGEGSTVSGNTVYQNGYRGIRVGIASTVSGNTVYQNAGTGIWAPLSTVSGNTIYQNVSSGIDAPASTISGNAVSLNGGDGIVSSGASMVSGNTSGGNSGWGLNLYPDDGYRDNVITSNTAGTVTGGVDAGGNVCNGTTTCP